MKWLKSIVFTVLYIISMLCISIMAQHNEVPRSYLAHKALESLVVDGIANESSWQLSSFSECFIDIEGVERPKFETKIKMLWDEEYFYIFAAMQEPHIWGNLNERDTVIFYNNDFEVFIDPDGDTHNYYELEVNSLNTQWDLFLTKPYRNGGKAIDSWDIQGLKTAVHIDGTLNDSNDEDKGWSIEMAIPWSVLTEAASHGQVPLNEFWRINFSRVNWNFDLKNGKYSRMKDKNGNFFPEYNWVWSPQWVVNMHEPERWGYVFFSSEKSTSQTKFEIPKDEYIKWELYHWYRALYKTSDIELPKEIVVWNKQIPLNFKQSLGGWYIWCESPFSGRKLIIEQDGKFSQEK